MKLDQTVIERLRKPITITWNYIGSDVVEICGEDNEAAIECCIDADRMTTCAGDREATDLVRSLIEEHKYNKVLKFLSKNFRFV